MEPYILHIDDSSVQTEEVNEKDPEALLQGAGGGFGPLARFGCGAPPSGVMQLRISLGEQETAMSMDRHVNGPE